MYASYIFATSCFFHFVFQTEHIKRTHDYEPFIKEFVACLQQEGLLEPLLSVDDDENGAKRLK